MLSIHFSEQNSDASPRGASSERQKQASRWQVCTLGLRYLQPGLQDSNPLPLHYEAWALPLCKCCPSCLILNTQMRCLLGTISVFNFRIFSLLFYHSIPHQWAIFGLKKNEWQIFLSEEKKSKILSSQFLWRVFLPKKILASANETKNTHFSFFWMASD